MRDTVVTEFDVIDLDDHLVVESWSAEEIARIRAPLVDPTPSSMRRIAERRRCSTLPFNRR